MHLAPPPPQRARADAKAALVGDGCVIIVAATKPNHTLPSSVPYSTVLLALGKASLAFSFLSFNVLEGYSKTLTISERLLFIQRRV